jgi:hypothetical protein
VNAGGLVLVLAGAVIISQVVFGDAMGRLGVTS